MSFSCREKHKIVREKGTTTTDNSKNFCFKKKKKPWISVSGTIQIYEENKIIQQKVLEQMACHLENKNNIGSLPYTPYTKINFC